MSQSPTDLEKSIIKTLAWFSVFARPITVFEIWKWLIEPARNYDLFEVSILLSSSVFLKDRIETTNGFFCLKQNEDILSMIERRDDQHVDAVKKFRVLQKVAWWFRACSCVRAVAVVNSLAWFSTHEESDIDLFIITKPNRVWTARLWSVLPFLIFGMRPSKSKKVSNAFCFSFFVSPKKFEMQPLCLSGGDHYFAFWIRSIVPIFDCDHLFKNFFSVNLWLQKILPNAPLRSAHRVHKPRSFHISIPIPAFMEKISRQIQQKRLPKVLRDLANKDSRVIVSDDILKFHENDRRQQFENQYVETYSKIIAL